MPSNEQEAPNASAGALSLSELDVIEGRLRAATAKDVGWTEGALAHKLLLAHAPEDVKRLLGEVRRLRGWLGEIAFHGRHEDEVRVTWALNGAPVPKRAQ